MRITYLVSRITQKRSSSKVAGVLRTTKYVLLQSEVA